MHGKLATVAPPACTADPGARGAADPDVGGGWLAGLVSKAQYYTATSIDGFIADSGGSLDWLFQAGTSSGKEDRFSEFFAGVGAMAMGATTYEWVLGHENLVEEPGRWRQYYGAVPCWVFTHRHLPVIPGVGLFFAHGDVRPVHEQMARAADGRNTRQTLAVALVVWVDGWSPALAFSLTSNRQAAGRATAAAAVRWLPRRSRLRRDTFAAVIAHDVCGMSVR